ncbi:MAG: amidophosphoribosyltransferase [Candidatus Brocadiia bacterium]
MSLNPSLPEPSSTHDLHDKCGVFGIFGHPRAALLADYGLYALQHRGEESAGIVVSDGTHLVAHRKMGLAGSLDMGLLEKLKGSSAVGHVRYSTTGSSIVENAQPLVARYAGGSIAVAHNGNLVNTNALRSHLERQGSIFQTTSDSEIIIHLLARPEYSGRSDRMEACLGLLRGAFSFVFLTQDALYATRDRFGYRPLALGKLGDAYAVASETCAFDLIGAEYVRDIEPGEVLRIDSKGLHSSRVGAPDPGERACCLFEHVYFARPDSKVFGRLVYASRFRAGEILAHEAPVEADLVVPVPDSGIFAGLGYSSASGIPMAMGFIRNHYVGRTFILPDQGDRDFRVRVKLNVVGDVVKGKRIVVVDDSIIRGTTTLSRVNILRQAGAKEIHLRIACPPTRHPCFYGIDFPDPRKLVAFGRNIEEVRREVAADSLAYLSEKGVLDSVDGRSTDYCMACWTGVYKEQPEEGASKYSLENPTSGCR